MKISGKRQCIYENIRVYEEEQQHCVGCNERYYPSAFMEHSPEYRISHKREGKDCSELEGHLA